jgi:hypothetical protein
LPETPAALQGNQSEAVTNSTGTIAAVLLPDVSRPRHSLELLADTVAIVVTHLPSVAKTDQV